MFINAWFCIKCDHRLSHTQVMYSNGRCPYCGYKDPKACTVVETYEKVIEVNKLSWKERAKHFLGSFIDF